LYVKQICCCTDDSQKNQSFWIKNELGDKDKLREIRDMLTFSCTQKPSNMQNKKNEK
jgi:hypothetical protein